MTGSITITAKPPIAAGTFHWVPKTIPATVSIDDGPEVPLPWGEPVTFDVPFGEHDVVINPDGPRPTVDTCCWVDEDGVRLEYVTAHRRSLLCDRIRYLD